VSTRGALFEEMATKRGRVGENKLNGIAISGKCELQVQEGDRLSIVSPGGGGWGYKPKS